MDIEQKMKEYKRKGFFYEQMDQIRFGLEQGLNISIYDKSEFDWVGYWLSMLRIKPPRKLGTGCFCSEFVALELLYMPSFSLPRRPWTYRPTQLAVDLQSQSNLTCMVIDQL